MSLLVSALTNEPKTARMQQWPSTQRPGELAISEWVATEFSAALSIKLRARSIEAPQRALAIAAFAQLAVESFEVFTIADGQFRTAAGYANQSKLELRAGDALHLAIAADHGAPIVTLDRGLAEAAAELAVPARLL